MHGAEPGGGGLAELPRNFPPPFCRPSAALLVQNHRFVNRIGVTTDGGSRPPPFPPPTRRATNNADV